MLIELTEVEIDLIITAVCVAEADGVFEDYEQKIVDSLCIKLKGEI
jgi:tellurite resistance protein